VKLFLLSFLLLNFSLAQDSPEKEIEVELGIDKIEKLDFAYSTKVQIGNDSVLQLVLAPQKREMTFRGIKEGKTSVTIRNTVGDVKLRYIVNVKASANSKTVSELRDFLDEVEGIDIVIKGGKVVVEGYIVVPEDIGLVSTVLSKYPDVIRLIELSPQTQRVISKKIKDELVRNGLKDVNVRIINKTFWLEGVVGSNGQKQFAQQNSRSLYS
jgi:pilus assembly protein CpaC